MNNGNVNYNNKNNNNCVRAVSEFRMITMNAVYNISLDELFEAYWTCRRKKSRSRAASLFEADYEHNLIELREEINAGIYAPRASRAFDSRAREPGYVYRNAERLAASVNSYLGLMRHHASFGIRRRLVESLAPYRQMTKYM